MYNLLSDTPSKIDRLGFAPMAKTLTEVIMNTDPPFTVGVFGEWGSGKSTLMGLVDRELEGRERVKTVWFNAWKYDGKEVIWNALIQSVFYAMRKEAQARGDDDLLERIGAAASNLAMFAARKLAPIASGGLVTTETFDKIAEALRPLTAQDSSFEFINSFEKTFSDLVGEHVGPEGRLVVFVDDLDRCLPENAVEVLEAIKLYLDSANITFVIGVEPEVVRDGIRHRYIDNPALQEKEYLEKIVQLPFVMRGLSREAAMELIAPFAKSDQYQYDELVIALILEGTQSNPRRIKRFINTFYVLAQMRLQNGNDISPDDVGRLALVLLTQMRFPDLYEELVRAPGLIGEYNDVMRKPHGERDDSIKRKRALERIFESPPARSFFELADTMDCSEDTMKAWVLLAHGEGQGGSA